MKSIARSLLFSATLSFFLGELTVCAEPHGPTLTTALQLLLVESDGWSAPRGRLQRLERPRLGVPFSPVGKPVEVWLGRAGMAPAPTAENAPLTSEPHKREGDGRSPAGVFSLGDLWGYAKAAPPGVRLSYHQASERARCVDDPGSPSYGQIALAPAQGPEPWRSAEHLRLPTDHYKYLVVIDYNTQKPKAGDGSCIFLHVAPPPGEPTAGCTALVEEEMLTVLRWLDVKKQPLLLQFPRAVLEKNAQRFELPMSLFQ